MRITPPVWYNPPIAKWLPCKVISDLSPQGLLVELTLDGEHRSIVAPYNAVRMKDGETLPAPGELFVVIVAELPEDGGKVLTELPATPINGSQRVKADKRILEVA
jgi:hypothetical protein